MAWQTNQSKLHNAKEEETTATMGKAFTFICASHHQDRSEKVRRILFWHDYNQSVSEFVLVKSNSNLSTLIGAPTNTQMCIRHALELKGMRWTYVLGVSVDTLNISNLADVSKSRLDVYNYLHYSHYDRKHGMILRQGCRHQALNLFYHFYLKTNNRYTLTVLD